jgi:hypothetical protein
VIHVVTSLLHLWSFSHAQCDAILLQRGIALPGAFSPEKTGWASDTVYFGFFWFVGMLAFVGASSFLVWRRRDTRFRAGRIVFPIGVVFVLFLLFVQLRYMAHYVDTCRQILGLPSLSS